MSKNNVMKFVANNVMYIVLLVLVLIFATQSPTFLTPSNLINVVNQCVYYIIVGVGIALIMLSGAMDLSVGYQMSVIAVIMGIMSRENMGTGLIVVTGILLGVFLSLINGIIYSRLKVFPFIITLATQYVFYGATYLISNSKTFTNFSGTFKILGQYKFDIFHLKFPLAIIIMIVIVLLGSFILNKTYFGRNIYALGSNPEAVALSGVSVAKMRVMVFALAGAFIGLGTIMIVSRVGSSSSTTGVGAEFWVMAGAMLGGIKMGGGGGKMSNVVTGMLILQVLQNGMNLMKMNTYWQNIAMGIILLIAITIDTMQTNRVVKKAKLVAGAPPPEEDEPETK